MSTGKKNKENVWAAVGALQLTPNAEESYVSTISNDQMYDKNIL